ncbi:acyltransferase family protein, partial [Herbaspirillum sp. UBA812]
MMKRLMGAWRFRVSTADGMAGAKNSKVSAYADTHGGGHQAYRADIDGLRTVAVLSVLVFHAFPSLLPGGFVGVDIFFVISGFLISGIIFREVQAGTFTFADFYSRRVRRIFPALMLVLVCSAAAGWFVLLAEEYATLGKHVVAGVVFVSNILLWRESGYFDVTSELKPLLHLWSLGVEEQFYLFWPVIVLCAARWKMRVIRMAIGLAVLSFVCNIALMQLKPVATFFLLPTRFWELMAGGILAWYLPSARVRDFLSNSLMRFNGKSISNADIAALLGLSLLLVAIFGLDADVEFPGWYALLPVVGAVCLILAGPSALINRCILAAPLMVAIGLISYPLYLWHWPIMAFLRNADRDLTPTSGIVAIALSFLMAILTFVLLEKPLRQLRGTARRNATLVLLIVSLLVIGGGTLLVVKKGFPGHI